MRRTHFFLIGMLLFSLIAVNIISPINADENRGTRSPDAGVEITAPSDDSGKPTETVSYEFDIKNVGDQPDSFDLSAESSHNWETDLSHDSVGPLNVNETASVTVFLDIPMGISEGTVDLLTLTATSDNDYNVTETGNVSTTVELSFIIEMDIEGGTSWSSGVNPPEGVNYTLTLRNKGNEDVSITLNYTVSNNSWNAIFSKFPDVSVLKAEGSNEGIKHVNITVTAPLGAQPNETMNLTIWGEKTDRDWYSYDYQNNITITTVVEPILDVRFELEQIEAFAISGDTIYRFDLRNSGNINVKADLVTEWPNILFVNLDQDQMIVRANSIQTNTLRVHTASDATLGNYTINITAVDNLTGNSIAYLDVYYIVVPVLNITNISISDDEPIQYKTIDVFVTIENIGYIDAKNITIKLLDGENKVREEHLDYLNSSDTTEVKISWSPSDFGNRSIKVSIDVEGIGEFSSFGTDVAEKTVNVDVKINWQPYYLAIYVIIIIILGIATLSAIFSLRYHGGVPHLNHLGEGTEDMAYEDYPEEAPSSEGGEEGEGPFAPFGMAEEKDVGERGYPQYEPHDDRPYPPPPPREVPPERDIPPPLVLTKDPETQRKEDELRDELRRLEDRLDRTKSLGVNTTNIDQLLKTANKSLNEGDQHKAKQYIGYGNERLDNLISKRDEAFNAIREAKELLSQMRGSADLTIVENFLVKADSLFSEGDFREAKNYANKAKERAVRLQRQEMRL